MRGLIRFLTGCVFVLLIANTFLIPRDVSAGVPPPPDQIKTRPPMYSAPPCSTLDVLVDMYFGTGMCHLLY